MKVGDSLKKKIYTKGKYSLKFEELILKLIFRKDQPVLLRSEIPKSLVMVVKY